MSDDKVPTSRRHLLQGDSIGSVGAMPDAAEHP
jgi:hypothetical protein